jgi:aryl-alcohol dehydrogenase-like predicted oxidoreductase
MYAWEFQALNTVAEKNGWHKFISMQDYHSLLHREEEREMVPYCRSAGIGLIPWSPLARGLLARPYQKSPENQTTRQTTDYYADMLIGPVTEVDIAIINRVQDLAKRKSCSMAQISIAWSLKKGFNPIIGISRLERVDEAVQAVALANNGLLTDEDVRFLDELYLPKAPLVSGW